MSPTLISAIAYIAIGLISGLVAGVRERSSTIDDFEAGLVALWVFAFWPAFALAALFALSIKTVNR